MSYATSPICRTCGSYNHPFLVACVSCGTRLGYRALPDAVTVAAHAKLNPPSAVVREALETGEFVSSQLSMIGYRYLGGLPGQVGQFNATLTVVGTDLVLRSQAGDVARVPVFYVLAVVPFVEEVPLIKGAVGVGFGNAFGFGTPAFTGGGLVVSYAADGQPFSFTVGNRAGLTLTAKGKPEFFRGAADLIGNWARDAALGRQAEVGVESYARELGIDPPAWPWEDPEYAARKAKLQRRAAVFQQLDPDVRNRVAKGELILADALRAAGLDLESAGSQLAPAVEPSREEPPAQPMEKETKTCPMCAEEVKAAAKICRFCRYEFEPADER